MKKILLFSFLMMSAVSSDCKIVVGDLSHDQTDDALAVIEYQDHAVHKTATPAWKRYPRVFAWGLGALACGAGSAVYICHAGVLMYVGIEETSLKYKLLNTKITASSMSCLGAIALGELSCYCGRKAIENWRKK